MPGGQREEGESDQDALVREIQEELRVILIPESIARLEEFSGQAHGKPEGTMVRIRCYTEDFTGTLTPASEIEEFGWFRADADTNLLSIAGISILRWLKERDLVD